MKNNKRFIFNLICILTGICAFVSANIAYAMSRVQEFVRMFGIILIIVPCVLTVAFVSLLRLAYKWNMKKEFRLWNLFKDVCAVTFAGWILLAGCFYFFKEAVLYTNSPVRQELLNKIHSQDNFEEISIKVESDICLQGFLYKDSNEGKTPLAIYFGGRGEEASSIVEYAAKAKGYSLAFINYRGCGLSNGTQSREDIIADSMAIYDYFAARSDIDNDNIILIAHSLGTGVAINLAAERKVKGIALSAPYDQYTSGVIQDKVPLIPVKIMLSDEFDSLAIAPKLTIPALFLLAEKDRTIIRSRSMRLYNSWGGRAESVIIEGTHHENITINNYTWKNINNYIDKLINH